MVSGSSGGSGYGNGRVALVTGANTGIGRVTALELARRGMRVFLAGRSLDRTRPVLEEISALHGAPAPEFLPVELGDLDSVRACAAAFLSRDLPLHLMVNNAGLAGARGLTRSGFEMAFGVNHVGHFVLTLLLLPRLLASAPSRVVSVASRAHRRTPGIDWDALRRPTGTWLGVREYATSKLANILFSAELGRRLVGRGVTTYSLHPGVIDTDIWRELPAPLRALNRWRLANTAEGASTTLHCALSPEAGDETALYYSDCRRESPSALAQDPLLARQLWAHSEEWTGTRFELP
ncbi:MAG: SDR family NAD(P)-dependent oxidoreductase [Betaproteobacteria bacterium]|jgi:NAD(P)-dependent dehydrogenase (short-subunit alcohol dehydrogenase family)